MVDSAGRQFQHDQQNMNRNTLLVMLLFFTGARCWAVTAVQPVSRAQAKEWGMVIRTALVATNQVGVWLELSPAGKLRAATSALLEIGAANQNRVSKTLLPLAVGKVIFYFSTEPADLAASTVTVYAKVGGGNSPATGFQLKIIDFINSGDVVIPAAEIVTNPPGFAPSASSR